MVSKDKLGAGGGGGKVVNVDNKHMKYYKIYIQSLVKISWIVGHQFISEHQLASLIPSNNKREAHL
jgi:hypothetical protein